MSDTNPLELAYFAGFFDGEGMVAIYKSKYVVCLTNTDIRPLKRAKEVWGGHINCQPASGRQYAVRDLWRWQIYGHYSRKFLEDIRPYSILKIEQIDIYLEHLSLVPIGKGLHSRDTVQRQALNDKRLIASSRLRLLKRGE